MSMATTMLGLLLAVGGVGEPAGETSKQCCFTNPRYAGECREEPTAETTCADILRYLNSGTSTGKTYCGNTDIRGGWKQVTCCDEEDGAEAATPEQG